MYKNNIINCECEENTRNRFFVFVLVCEGNTRSRCCPIEVWEKLIIPLRDLEGACTCVVKLTCM